MIPTLIVALTFLANLVLFVVVWKNNPKSWTNRLLTGLIWCMALWTVTNFLALSPGEESTRLFWVRVVMAVTAPIGGLTYLLAATFPKDHVEIAKVKLGLVVTTTVLGLVLSPWMFTELHNQPDGGFGLVPGLPIVLFALNHFGYTIAGLVVLVKKYRRSVGTLKSQLFFVLLGLLLTLMLMTLTNFVAVVIFKTMQYTFVGPVTTLLQVGFVAYAIIRHRFLDMSALLARAVSFTLLILVVVGLELGMVWGVSRIVPEGVDRGWVAMAGAVLIILGYDMLRGIVTRMTEKLFFRGRYDTEEVLKQLTRIMAAEIEMRPLSSQLETILAKEMKVNRVVVGWQDEMKEQWGREWLIFDELEEGGQKERMRVEGVRVVVPLLTKDELVGVVTMGDKLSGEIYSAQDMELLEILAPQAAVTMKNAQSYHQIQEFNKTLEARVEERSKELLSAQERELQKTTELLKLKNEFVFMASHDIATPVAAISGYMALIRDSKDKLTSEMQENLKAIGESTERLKSLVNDLLQIARGESGTMRVVSEKIDLKLLEKNVERRVGLLAKNREVALEVAKIEALEIVSDGQKIMEIMENLLTNAIRYRLETPEKWVKVMVKKESDKLAISVVDNGFGIPVDEQDKVFTKFFRSERKEVREQPGTGLGLYVSQMLAHNLGGEISFKSEEGAGSTFTLTLPLDQTEQKGVK